MNKRFGLLVLALCLAAPAAAQDDASTDDANPYGSFDDAGGGDDPYGSFDDGTSDAGDSGDGGYGSFDDGSGDGGYGSFDDGSDSPYGSFGGGEDAALIPVDEAVEEEADPLPIYVGLDSATTTVSVTNVDGIPGGDYDSGMYRLRVGAEFIEDIGIEVHFGVDQSDGTAQSLETESYYGLFATPTATVLDTVELGLLVGYATSSYVQGGGSGADLDSVAFGASMELPLRSLMESAPDLRITGGWMVYHQKGNARVYGANVGLRYGFTTAGVGFGGFGDFLGGLWPFGDDEE